MFDLVTFVDRNLLDSKLGIKRRLRPLDAGAVEIVRAKYALYTATVSNSVMAISWHTSSLLLEILSTRLFNSCLDFGSGFTSYLTRYWTRQLESDCLCVSVDDSLDWSERTRQFLQLEGLSADYIFTTDEYLRLGTNRPQADLVIYDYSGYEAREKFLAELRSSIHADSIILFDDFQRKNGTMAYNNAVHEWCRTNELRLISLWKHTIDGYGRFAALAYNPKSPSFRRLLWRI